MSENINRVWDFIIEEGIATEEELQLITSINGYNEKSLNDVIYCRTAYHGMEQYKSCEGDDDEE